MVKCASCDRYKTHTLHECVGVVEEMMALCDCTCEKTQEVRERMENYRLDYGLTMAEAFRNLTDAINDATNSFATFKVSVNTSSSGNSNKIVPNFTSNTTA